MANKDFKFNPEKLVNWSYMSETLSGGTMNIHRKKRPAKYKRQMKRLFKVLEVWARVYGKKHE